MASNEHQAGLEQQLGGAIDELQAALQRASEATASIKTMLPRVSAIRSLLDEVDAVIHSGRQQLGAANEPAAASAVYTRPTLVVPSASAARPTPAIPALQTESAPQVPEAAAGALAAIIDAAALPSWPSDAPGVVCFRLEFESRPGPLDLRTVDDAVSEHPSVRDVALLDYDGRKATLKVWIDGSSSPADVQQALVERSSQLFAAGNDVTIVALEDVA
jgi:hypothetical protein